MVSTSEHAMIHESRSRVFMADRSTVTVETVTPLFLECISIMFVYVLFFYWMPWNAIHVSRSHVLPGSRYCQLILTSGASIQKIAQGMDSENWKLLSHRYLSVGIALFICFRTMRKALLKWFRTGKQNIDHGCACFFFFAMGEFTIAR